MTAPKTLLYVITAVLLSAGVASAQYCKCVYRTNTGTATKCLPTLPQFSCDDTCVSDTSPGVVVQSATRATSCQDPPKQPQPKPAPQLSAYQRLVQGALYTIGHEGFTPYTGSNSDVMLSGEALRNLLYHGQGRADQATRDNIRDASLSDLEKATDEALQMCRWERGKAFASLSWVWGHEGQGATMQRDADAKNYQGIRNVHNQFEHDVALKNLLACFSGPEIQQMVDAFKTQPPPPPPPPASRPNPHTHP
jgi:hypothetical protein